MFGQQSDIEEMVSIREKKLCPVWKLAFTVNQS